MSILSRLNYYRRIFPAYLTSQKSQLTFWHEVPEVNDNFDPGRLGEYYMSFTSKADYPGHYDKNGIPLLDYHGKLGLQYNPIAIAQYGLGNYNQFCRTGDSKRRQKFIAVANWLISNLEQNSSGLWVWNHHFDWEYRTMLKAPWYSGLAQGQGISLLVRAYLHTKKESYLNAAQRAFVPFTNTIKEGGVTYLDEKGYTWFEEYIVCPPTHILNGFIWASWGVYDYYLATGEQVAKDLFNKATDTLAANIYLYDAGFWSLYELSDTKMKMLASPFYHNLHIVQLKVMHRLTGEEIFQEYAMKWDKYRQNFIYRNVSLIYKGLFKIFYY